MTVSEQDIVKLRAIGYQIPPHMAIGTFVRVAGPLGFVETQEFDVALSRAKAHAQGPGLKATMGDKVRWLIEHGPGWSSVVVDAEFGSDGPTGDFVAKRESRNNGKLMGVVSIDGASPEAAIDKLFWATGT